MARGRGGRGTPSKPFGHRARAVVMGVLSDRPGAARRAACAGHRRHRGHRRRLDGLRLGSGGDLHDPDDGTGGFAQLDYSKNLGIGGGVPLTTWTFQTTAAAAGTVNLDYALDGLHAWFTSRWGSRRSSTQPAYRATPFCDGPVELLHAALERLLVRRARRRWPSRPATPSDSAISGSNSDFNSFLQGTLRVGYDVIQNGSFETAGRHGRAASTIDSRPSRRSPDWIIDSGNIDLLNSTYWNADPTATSRSTSTATRARQRVPDIRDHPRTDLRRRVPTTPPTRRAVAGPVDARPDRRRAGRPDLHGRAGVRAPFPFAIVWETGTSFTATARTHDAHLRLDRPPGSALGHRPRRDHGQARPGARRPSRRSTRRTSSEPIPGARRRMSKASSGRRRTTTFRSSSCVPRLRRLGPADRRRIRRSVGPST